MITREMIAGNPVFSSLTDEQVAALVTLSSNDEAQVIAGRVAEIHGQYDEDILAATGLAKPGGVKTYTHLKAVLADLKGKADKATELKTQIAGLTTERDQLNEKIKSGDVGGALAQKVTSLERELADKNTQVTKLQADFTTVKEDYESRLSLESEKTLSIQIDHAFEKALSGVKYKDESIIPKDVRTIMIEAAKTKALAKGKPSFEERDGKKVLVFRDAAGNIITNPNNLQNPADASDLLLPELEPIIDGGRRKEGGGTNPPGGGGGANGKITINPSDSREDQDRAIRMELANSGLVAGTDAFQEALAKAWEDNGLKK